MLRTAAMSVKVVSSMVKVHSAIEECLVNFGSSYLSRWSASETRRSQMSIPPRRVVELNRATYYERRYQLRGDGFRSLFCSPPKLDKQIDRGSRERVTTTAAVSTLVRK